MWVPELPLNDEALGEVIHVIPTVPHCPPSLRSNIDGCSNLAVLLTSCVTMRKHLTSLYLSLLICKIGVRTMVAGLDQTSNSEDTMGFNLTACFLALEKDLGQDRK